MKLFAFILVFLLTATNVFATKFIPMEMKDRVAKSDLIAIGKVIQLRCLTKDGTPVAPLEKCTGPGLENKLFYKIELQEIMFQVKDKTKSFKPKESVEFGFNALSHWEVPKDNYASEIGKQSIFFLKLTDIDQVHPVHEAFFIVDQKNKKTVRNAILKRK